MFTPNSNWLVLYIHVTFCILYINYFFFYMCKIYSYFIQLTISTEAFPACNYKKFTRQYYLSSCTPHELQFITLYKKHYNKIKVQFLIKPYILIPLFCLCVRLKEDVAYFYCFVLTSMYYKD